MTQAAGERESPVPIAKFTVPEQGEALLTDQQLASVYEVSIATVWAWTKNDPDFPKPIRRGERFTRWRASTVRTHLASLVEGVAKEFRGERVAS